MEGNIKPENYYSDDRDDIVRILPQKYFPRVLDIGCGRGRLLLNLKKRGLAGEAYGIDITEQNPLSHIDHFQMIDIDQPDVNLNFPSNYFDLIICADLLEHLRDPWAFLLKLKPLLCMGGQAVFSIPNIRDIAVLFSLVIKGRFKYVPSGVLDKTHFRFFTKRTMLDMIENAGFDIISVSYELFGKRKLLNALTLGLFSDFLVRHYLIQAVVQSERCDSNVL